MEQNKIIHFPQFITNKGGLGLFFIILFSLVGISSILMIFVFINQNVPTKDMVIGGSVMLLLDILCVLFFINLSKKQIIKLEPETITLLQNNKVKKQFDKNSIKCIIAIQSQGYVAGRNVVLTTVDKINFDNSTNNPKNYLSFHSIIISKTADIDKKNQSLYTLSNNKNYILFHARPEATEYLKKYYNDKIIQ